MTRRGTAAAAVLAALLGSSCRRAPEPVLFDLAALAPVAESESARQLILFGVAGADKHQRSGLITATGEPDSDPHALARRRAEITLTFTDRRPRVAVLDLAALPGLAGQACEVRFNDEVAGRFPVSIERGRHAVRLDPARLREGENVLGLLFDQVSERQTAFHLKLAARLFGLTVTSPDDPALGEMLAAGAPPFLGTARPDGIPEIQALGPARLRFVLPLPEGGSLRFLPQLNPASRAAGGAAVFRVTVQEEGGAERDLWRGLVRATDDPDEEAVELPRASLLGVTLHLENAPGGRRPWGVWRAPRVTGKGPADPLLAAAAPRPETPAPANPAPRAGNVVLVILDAAGARHVSSYGYARRTTPTLDRLAGEGVLFEEAHSPAGYTMLAMGSVWTSQHPDEHHNGTAPNAKLPGDIPTLAELLGVHGIHTAGFVGNGMAGPAFGLERGFAEFEEVFRKHGGGAHAFRAVLPAWLGRHARDRFFLYVHFREPHFPYDPPAPFDQTFGPPGPLPPGAAADPAWLKEVNSERGRLAEAERRELERRYDANLAYVDSELAELLRNLEAHGLMDRTAVIVTADHGEALGEHGFVGHEAQVYRDITHIPLVMRIPEGPRGLRRAGLVDLTDLAPTIADLLGLGQGGKARSFRGRSLLSALDQPRGQAFLVARTPGVHPRYALRHGSWTYHYHPRLGSDELFDLSADPGERQDLAARQPLRTALYRQALQRFVLEKRRGRRTEAAEAQLSPEQQENLKALGYVN